MSESAESTSSYVTPDTSNPDLVIIPENFDRAPSGPVVAKTGRKRIGAGLIFSVIFGCFVGVQVKNALYDPPSEGPVGDPKGNLRVPQVGNIKGCPINNRLPDLSSFGCQLQEDLDSTGSAALPPRTYIEPLPEGVSGRVASNALAATPTDLGGSGLSLSLALK